MRPTLPTTRWRRRPVLRLWHWLAGGWPALTAAAIGTSLWLAVQPLSWRRPVRDEFWRFAQVAGPGSLVPILVAAVLIGIGLVGQSVFWLDRLGQRAVVETTLLVLLIREVAPLVVGLVMLGRAGLLNLSELGAMQADGTVRSLQAQGLDPVLLFVMPRALALGLCTFVHGLVFLSATMLVGHVMAELLGVAAGDVFCTARLMLRVLGEVGVFVLPAKSIFAGVAIAAATSITALSLRGQDPGLMPKGFFRALLGLFLVSLVGSLSL